jgi:cell division septum initiation protein DivIVA
MAAIDDIHALENKINDGLKRIDELKAKRAKAEDNAKKLGGAIVAAQNKVTLHRKNRLHMKNVSMDVSWEQFKITLAHLDSAKLTVEESKVLLAAAESAMAACDTETAAIVAAIAKVRAKLSEYGQVIEVNFRRAA